MVVKDLHRPDMQSVLETKYFTIDKFQLMKQVMIFLSIVSAIVLMLFIRFRKKLMSVIDQLSDDLLRLFKQINCIYTSFNRSGKIYLFVLSLLLLARSIYYATSFDIQYDEAWNYNLFLDQHFYYSMAAYNNYPFHNLITWLFVHAFGNSVFVLRLPVILMGLFTVLYTIFATQFLVKKQWVALLSGTVFACLPVSVFYMMYARGVMFEIFFVIVLYSLLIYFLQTKFSLKRILLLAVLNALGTYSMLSHPYFILASFAALFIYGLMYSRELIRYSIIYLVASFLFSFIQFIPMIAGSGMSPGIHATLGLQAASFTAYINHVEELSYFITGFSYTFYMITLILLALLFYSFKKNKLTFFISSIGLLLLSLNISIPFFLNSFLPERGMSFMVIIPMSLVILLFSFMQQRVKNVASIFLMALILISISSYRAHTHHFLNWSKELDHKVQEVAQKLYHEKINSAYNDSRDFDYFIPGIEFYFKQHGSQFNFSSSAATSTRYSNQIDPHIESIIVDIHHPLSLPEDAEKLYSLDQWVIYNVRH